MKQGDKRILNDDFEQVEECDKCKKLFWAKSEYELGNWESYCKKCSAKNQEEEKKEEEIIKKNGAPRYGSKGQIFAWTLGENAVFNNEYKPQSEEEEMILANGFVDIDKYEKRFAAQALL